MPTVFYNRCSKPINQQKVHKRVNWRKESTAGRIFFSLINQGRFFPVDPTMHFAEK